MAARGWGQGGNGCDGLMVMGPFGGHENVLELDNSNGCMTL